jgi:hypothetical protein
MKLHTKRLLSCSVVLSAVMAGFLYTHYVSAAGEIKLYTSPSSTTQTTGSQFDVAVRISKTASDRVDYADVYVSFPASRLEVVSVSASGTSFNLSSSFASSYNNTSGLVHISGESNALGTPADVLVATIKLRAKASGRSDVTFTSDSVVGDLFGPGKVKNYLTTRAGVSVTVNSVAVPTSPAPGTAKPVTSPTTTDSTPPDAPIDTPLNDIVNTPDGSYELAIDGVGTSSAGNGVGAAVPDRSDTLLDRYGIVGGAVLGTIVLSLAAWKVFGAHRERQGATPEAIVIWDDTAQASDNETILQEENNIGAELDQLASELPADPVPQPEYVPIPETPEPIAVQPMEQPVAESIQLAPVSMPEIQPPAAVTPEPIAQPVLPMEAPPTTRSGDDIPDMFDLGEERLRQEGYVSNVGPRAPQA